MLSQSRFVSVEMEQDVKLAASVDNASAADERARLSGAALFQADAAALAGLKMSPGRLTGAQLSKGVNKRGRGGRRQPVMQSAPGHTSHTFHQVDVIDPDLRDRTGTAPTANMMSDAIPQQPLLQQPLLQQPLPQQSLSQQQPLPQQPLTQQPLLQQSHQQSLQQQPLPPQQMMVDRDASLDSLMHDDDYPDELKPRRELSQSKRAAQNRAAQRAFRQRKEFYIKKLEAQVEDYLSSESKYKGIRAENFALADYVHVLQNCLMEAQIEVPPPPPGLNLNRIGQSMPTADGSDMTGTNAVSLDAVAQAVVGLADLGDRQQLYASPGHDPASEAIQKLLEGDQQP